MPTFKWAADVKVTIGVKKNGQYVDETFEEFYSTQAPAEFFARRYVISAVKKKYGRILVSIDIISITKVLN